MAANARGSATHTATRCRTYRNGASRPEWQCPPHGTARSGPSGSADHTATRRRAYRQHALTLPLDVERTETCVLWCGWPYCSPARPHTATRRRAYRNGTSRPEWQCPPHGTARSGPSGSATHTATRRRAHGLHALTLPLDVERTETVRSGPSGSATCTGPHAQGRVAVPSTLPNGIERTEAVRLGSSGSAIGTLRAEWQCISHCHSMVNVRFRNVQGRVAVRARATPP